MAANAFLEAANVSSIEAARKLPTEILQRANMHAQQIPPSDVLPLALVVDGDVFLDIPPVAYSKNDFVKNISLIAAYNDNGARFLGNQSISTNADFSDTIKSIFPSAPANVTNHIVNSLYPPNSPAYSSPQERNDLAIREYLISCNIIAIANAYGIQTWNYHFSIPPAIHAQDLAYTYYPTPATPDFYPSAASALQRYLVHFVLTGTPDPASLLKWPNIGANADGIAITTTGVQPSKLDAANSRRDFWNSGVYFL